MTAQPQLRFDAAEHRYYLGEQELPSVTRILSDIGLVDNSWIDPWYRLRGQRVHEGCRLVNTGEWDPDTTHPSLVPYIRAYELFLRTEQFRVKLFEEPLYSPSMQYAGTLDLWGWRGDSRWLPDLKSGRPNPATGIQIALYAYMLSEIRGLICDEHVSVWLKEDGTYQLFPVPQKERARNMQLGLSAVMLWHWRRQHGRLPNGKEGR